MEDNDHIKAIEEEDPQISFAAALQILDQFGDTEMQCLLATINEKLQDMRLQRRKQTSIKDVFSTKSSVQLV